MKFSDIVGQERVIDSLIHMYQAGRVPHAFLISGNEGTGVLPVALSVAQLLLCEQTTNDDSCGVCASCIKMKSLSHPDLLLSFPTIAPKPKEKPSSRTFISEFQSFVAQTPYESIYNWLQFINAENKQGNITADECRGIVEQLSLKSYEGGNKILLMWGPEYLGKEGNILLKIIEEPPPNTYIILATTEPDSILSTIMSRVQMIRLSPLAHSTIATALLSSTQVSPQKAQQAAQLSHGNYARALQLVCSEENELFPDIKKLFNDLFTQNGIGLSAFAERQAEQGREQQKNFLQLVIQMLQHSIARKYGQTKIDLLQEEADFVNKLAQMPLSLELLESMIKELEQTVYLIERNANSRIALHAMSIRLQYLIQNKRLPQFLK